MDFIRLVEVAERSVLTDFDACEAARLADAAVELESTVKIQRQTRRYFALKTFQLKKRSCCKIERVFRGHQGRKVYKELVQKKRRFEMHALFEYQASVIQHAFRGFYSRRYMHDFYARKAYIANILEKSNQLRIQLAANRQRAAQEEQERKMRETQDEFKKIASNLHHLLSTKSCPGIYNSPYAFDGKPTAFGVPVEDHLKNCTTEILRKKGMRVKRNKLPRERRRKSIQASSHYDSVKTAERVESRRSRTMRISDRDFQAGGKGPMENEQHPKGISHGTSFIDAWRIQQSSRDQPLRNGKDPFHTAVGKNKLFDEIADEVEEKDDDTIDQRQIERKSFYAAKR